MDVDLVLVLPQAGIKKLIESFDETHFYRPPREVIMEEAARPEKGHFNLIHHDTGFKADVYLAKMISELGLDEVWKGFHAWRSF